MTEPTEPLGPPDDELVSAYLDGELGPLERARVERDPAARRRVEELRTAAGALGTPPPPPGRHAQEAAVAAALAATADTARAAHPEGVAPSPRPGPHRARRWARLGVPAAAVAAAVVVLVLAVSVGDDAGPPVAAPTTTVDVGREAESFDAATPPGAGEGDDTAADGDVADRGLDEAELPTLGDVVTLEGLRQGLDAASASWEPTRTAACAAAVRTAVPGAVVAPRARVTWAGVPALVWSSDPTAAVVDVVVVDEETCAVLVSDVLPSGAPRAEG